MISWIVGILIILGSLGYGLLAMTASMMTDNPSEKVSGWPALAGLIVGVAVIVGHHYGVW